MKYIKKVLGEDLRQYTMVVALAALIIIFNIASGGKMITSSNFQNLISGNAYVLVLALGMLMVIVIGQIDLSVGSVAGFASMVMAITARQFNLPWYVAILVALAIGMIAGAWQGFFLSRLGIPGFITTLGGMMIFRGGVIWISSSISVPVPSELKWFGAGYLPEWGPAFTGMNNSTLLLGIIASASNMSTVRTPLKPLRMLPSGAVMRPETVPFWRAARVAGSSALTGWPLIESTVT